MNIVPPTKTPSREEAIELTRGPYAEIFAKTIAGSIAPFLWCEPEAQGGLNVRNGTAFFVSGGQTFLVTADHVFAGYLNSRQKFGTVTRCQLGNAVFDPEQRLIARSTTLDIATFEISLDEIKRTQSAKWAMSFDPLVPQKGRGVVIAGFPRSARIRLSELEIKNGIFDALTVAENITKRQISGHFERDRQVDAPWRPTAPPGYDLRGVSGAPLITVVDSKNLHYWRLGGVVTQFNENLEIFYAARADFILPDGTLKQI